MLLPPCRRRLRLLIHELELHLRYDGRGSASKSDEQPLHSNPFRTSKEGDLSLFHFFSMAVLPEIKMESNVRRKFTTDNSITQNYQNTNFPKKGLCNLTATQTQSEFNANIRSLPLQSHSTPR